MSGTTPNRTRNLAARTGRWGADHWKSMLFFPLAAIALIAAPIAPAGRTDKPVSNALASKLQKVVDTAVASPRAVFPGTELFVSQPELGTWRGAAGEADVHPRTPMNPNDTFRAGSIMKPFVATVVLQLVEEGKLSLDDPLTAVLPREITDRVAAADRITVRMLLNHTSGVPEYVDLPFDRMVIANPRRVWTVEEFLDRSARHPRQFQPGTEYAYSNTDYNLLGLVIEHVTGKPWRTEVRERVIDRIGLQQTSLPQPGRVSIGRGDAHGYELVNGKLVDVTDIDSSMAGAAGGNALVTTTEDLSRFLDALLAGKLFEKPGTLRSMMTFVHAKSDSGLPLMYGLGLERYTFPGGVTVIGHLGTAGGYRAFVGYVPGRKVAIAMMVNTGEGDPTPVLMPALRLMLTPAS
jgi:D-alanyl-D-alanine carboxypeptidase